MIKILILCAIVILSGGLGAAISREKKRDVKVLNEFCDFNEKLLLNLKFDRKKLSDIAEGYSFVKKAMNGEELIKGEAGDFIGSYLKNLGTTDAKSQIEYLTERGEELKKFRDNSLERYKKYGSLYFKLCLVAGILIAVLLA